MYKINKRGKGPNKSGGSDFFQKKIKPGGGRLFGTYEY